MPRHKERTQEEDALGLADNEFLDPNGYIRVRDHTRVGGNVLKHRLVMEQAIGRPLRKDEQVRFKGHKHNLDIKNLTLVTTYGDRADIIKKIKVKRVRIEQLKLEIKDLEDFLLEVKSVEQIGQMTPREAQVNRGEVPFERANLENRSQ
jgi:hypothetical protein